MRVLLLVAVCATLASAMKLPPLIRETALPLFGKRVMILLSRDKAAHLAAKLVAAGGRPIWAPAVHMESLRDYSDLDDALMRLAEYDVLVPISTHAIDAAAERWMSFADGDDEVVKAMIEASSVEIGAIGPDAQHLRKVLGVSATVVPIEPSPRAIASTLADLGHLQPEARVLLLSGVAQLPLVDPPTNIAAFLEEVAACGAHATRVSTHTVAPAARASLDAELRLLHSGDIDAVCVSSPEEVAVLAAGDDSWQTDRMPLIIALGDEAAAAAASKIPSAEILRTDAGARDGDSAHVEAAVSALEARFGGGRLLF